ncbi:DUF4870 domain-containing protein [Occallatibacter riparius]|uniref:DUF4870 domain-containing protein n=1 Tax=Occallatibacter riparius TaxID=1002689 RepID=A0A9J7BTC5_9BACT|nr:hypothetical protein [Occallatibacter riparius]UWZ86147.1 hypothetical protein MOP44_09410 [Occallatibacter riparius]
MPDPIQTPQAPQAQQAGLSENAACALAYVTFIPAIIFLATAPYNQNPKIKFHSWQSICLFIAAIVVRVAVGFLYPIFGWAITSMLSLVVSLGLFAVWLLVVINAVNGKAFKIPVIAAFAEKQAGTTI